MVAYAYAAQFPAETQAKLVAADTAVVMLKNTGHWVMEESPKETTGRLMGFLER